MVARGKRLSKKNRVTRRGNSLKASNARLEVRRNVLSSLNALLEEVGADALQVDRMTKPTEQAFDRLLRVLEKRCSAPELKKRFQKEMQRWVDNAGLPQNLRAPAVISD